MYSASASRQRQLAALLVLSFLTFFLGLGRPAISDADEGYYAEAAREMVETGDWLTPHFNYEDRWQKPVLYYWMAAGTSLVTGASEWSARCWSALSGVGLVLLTWVAGQRLGRGRDVAFIAGAIVATCYGYFAMARMALPDLPLTFFISLTIWAMFERRVTLAGIAAGLGFLMKGPVAVVVPAIVIAPLLWRERSSGGLWEALHIRPRDLAVAGGLFLLIGTPWYVAMTRVHGAAYLQSFFVGDNLERFATTRFNGPRSMLFYVPIVVGGLMPWAMYLLVLPWTRGIALVRRRAHLTREEWRLVVWCLAPLIFFSLSVGKQPRYVLPVLPPLAILLAQAMATRLEGDDRRERGLAVATWLTAGTFLLIAVLLFRARSLFISAYPAVTALSFVALIGCALAIAAIAVTRAWRHLPATLAASALLMLLALQFGALSGIRPEPVERMAALVRANRTDERVAEYQVFVRNLVFYTGFKHIDLFNEAMALDFLKSPERVLLVVRAEDLPRLESISGVVTRPLGRVTYLDTGTVRLRTLLWPIPADDLDTVLLVANR